MRRSRWLSRVLIWGAFCACAPASLPPSTWSVARSPHFEVFAQAGAPTARSALDWFELLRACFDRSGILPKPTAGPYAGRAVRVIGFRSAKEYESFRLRPVADAYYLAADNRDYIVMPGLEPQQFGMAAHEYAHLVLRSNGFHLPLWLSEGLAEYFSTIHASPHGYEIGGEAPARLDTLRRHAWMPLPELFARQADSPENRTRDGAAMFYAESWALTSLLAGSPEYAARFRELLAALNSGALSEHALATIYRKDLSRIQAEAKFAAESGHFTPITLSGIVLLALEFPVSEVSPPQLSALVADLLAAAGEFKGAEALYRDLARDTHANPDIFAALGTIALRKGDRKRAREEWGRALENGITDANLCYRYAVLADDEGLPESEIRAALQRAVALTPDFDDAHYKLALLESNAGDFAAALGQLRAVRRVSRDRAFGYWSAMAYALTELGEREEAEKAAEQAMTNALDDSQRKRAAQLAYMARTDLTVQFLPGADGCPHLVTTRIPHGTAAAWNPFIEPGDNIRRTEGTLREVQCADHKLTGFLVNTTEQTLTLSVPDPQHVLMRNSPGEFTCGVQPEQAVKVEYAIQRMTSGERGILRGMEFKARPAP